MDGEAKVPDCSFLRWWYILEAAGLAHKALPAGTRLNLQLLTEAPQKSSGVSEDLVVPMIWVGPLRACMHHEVSQWLRCALSTRDPEAMDCEACFLLCKDVGN
eukprot:3087944-Amphidinium_carterae.1